VQARFKALNVEYRHTTPEEFKSFVSTETDKWGKIIREAGIKLGG
jgi:tripartite-type tricarboxylate transporter receptor subunit TctC